jgi:ureidoglycolate lyase
LTAEAFRPFGEVIADGPVPVAMNDGTAVRYRDLATALPGPAGRVAIGIVISRSVTAMPLEVRWLERHPLATQAFMPLDGSSLVVIVAPPQPAPIRAESLRAFVGGPGQGINFSADVWHHPLIASVVGQRFLVIDRAGPGENLELADLNQPVVVAAQPAGAS